MKLEKELPAGSEDIPAVPDILKQHLLRKLRGPAVRVKIEAKTDSASGVSLNAIRLAERGSANNAPDVDEVAELVTRVIHAYHLEHESEDGYTSLFRITCELRSSDNKKPMSQRGFVIRYMPGHEDEDSELLRENDVLMQSLEMVRENNSSLSVQVSDLHQVVLDFARSMNEPIRASAEMSFNATQQWINGANLLVNAHQQMFNVDAVRISEEAKNKRIEQILGQFGGTLNHLTGGLVDWVMKKVGVRAPPQQQAKPAVQPQQQTDTPASATSGEASEGTAEPEPDKDKVLGALVGAFSHTITPVQRKAMNNHLTKKMLAALDELFCAESNDDVASAWEAAAAELGMEKLMWLATQLDVEQQNDFNSIRNYIGRYVEKRNAERPRGK